MTDPVALTSVPLGNRKLLFLGPAGSGKTTAAAMYRPTVRKHFLDVDEKLAEQENIPPEVRSRIDVWSPKEPLSGPRIGIARVEMRAEGKTKVPGTEGYIPENPRGFQKIVNYINGWLERIEKGEAYPYEVTVLDGLTTCAEHLDRLVKSHHKVSSFTIPLWGVFGTNLQELVKGFLALPGDKIVIAHTKLVKDEVTNEVHAQPLIQGFMADALPKEFNEVYFFHGEDTLEGKKCFVVRTRGNTKYPARTTKKFEALDSVERVLKEFEK